MDALTEGLARSDVDAEMTALNPEDVTELNPDASDEVEHLQNSLREAVHDDNVRPKMQCLMMDSSFSMVTMQGEDSGIEWETTSSRCTTPWASEAGNPPVDVCSPVAVRPSTPGSVPAGKIIFVMDEELISRRKKTKERNGQRSKTDRQVLLESSENVSGRPELIEVSQPNVKTEGEGDEEEANDPADKEQRLFSLVSEGSEILNIVVPPKVVSVDEEVSKEMVDNLSYLEESLVPKAVEDTHDYELVSTTESVQPPPSHLMDPPGAPVARPPARGPAGNVDYFEAFTMIDAQAPGSPAVVAQGQVEQEAEVETESQDTQNPVQSTGNTATTTTTVDNEKSDTLSLLEITSDLLDEVFYGSTDNYSESLNKGEGVAEGVPSKPLKPSGSTLFGSQEDILTPIFLPDGPPKIIDPILLEEPKAMAFLYTDLYEEAIGSREKEEDAESMTSEKSFHSRHSDREARGYLEKYVLIDETPAVEAEPTDEGKCPKKAPRVCMSEDLYDSSDMLPKSEKGEMPNSEEEITDFFRSSANSSPCDIEPFARSLEEDEPQTKPKSKDKKTKNVSIKVDKVPEIPDPLSISSFEFPSEEPDWEITDDHPAAETHEHAGQELWKEDLEVQKPVAPPRKKPASAPKACLDLTPLTPVEVIMQEKEEEAGGKEQREEEKETASPAETADEGDGEETMQTSFSVALSESVLAAMESPQTESVTDSNEMTIRNTAEEKDTKTVEEETSETEAATTQTEPQEVNIQPSELAETDKQGDSSTASPADPAKAKGQCVIL